MFGLFERLLDPFPSTRLGEPPKGLWPFVRHYVSDAWPWLTIMTLLSAIIAIGEVMLFGFMGWIVDWLASSEPESFWADHGRDVILMGVFVILVLPVAQLFWDLVANQGLMGNLPMSARWRMHTYLLGQSMDFYANEYAGRVATKVMQSALAVREVMMKVLDVFVYVAVFFGTMLILVASMDVRLAAPLALWMIAYGAMVWYFVPRLTRVSEKQADARSAMTGRIVDSYTNIATVKLFAHAGREEAYARNSMRGFLGTVYHQMRLATGFHVLVAVNNAVAIILVSVIGIFYWYQGDITPGAFAIALGLVLRIIGMSQWVMWEVSQLFENIGVVFDGMNMMAKHRAVEDRDGAKTLDVTEGKVAFENVGFHYGLKRSVIEDFSLTVSPGEKVGLVGRSGAGKSTLVNLLLRFYDVESGGILIDGQDIRSVDQDSLRKNIGMVTQDTSLLHRSLRDNVAYGRPGATEEDIWHALRRANADDFINDLSDQDGRTGLDAHVGERGVKLSGGQRQRIAIARMFLKNAPILVLDEATSALDSEVEAAIQQNFMALMEGKTVIAIAHRLSTISQMDRLIVIDEGRILEQGTHDELIAQSGLYSELWARQSGGFLDAEEVTPAAE